MATHPWTPRERGQATLMLLGALAALLVGALLLVGLGQALGFRSKHQRAADLAAVSAARAMADTYPRLFEPPYVDGLPNPRHLSLPAYLARARETAVRAARANGVPIRPADVRFPRGSFAPTRVTVIARGGGRIRVAPGRRRARVPVRARATAELAPDGGIPAVAGQASGGGYSGPLANRQGKPMRPDVAEAFDRLAAAARRDAGLHLSVTSGFRSDAEQARLFAANPHPRWVAPPGTSLHRYGTELDLGPPAAYAWLAANARRFGFIKRYAWEQPLATRWSARRLLRAVTGARALATLAIGFWMRVRSSPFA